MKLEMKLVNVGKALLPTYASASILRCSNLTSIDGKSIPTLFLKNKNSEKVRIYHQTRLKKKKGKLTQL